MIEVTLSPAQMRRTRNLQGRNPTLPPPPMEPVAPTGTSWPARAPWMINYENYKSRTKWTICSWKYLISCKCSSFHDISAPETKIRILKAFWIVLCHMSRLWMKNYHSLYVGMLYVIDTREQYLHLYCLRILFIFLYLFVNLWTKEGFLIPFTRWVHDIEGDAPSASTPFYCCSPVC